MNKKEILNLTKGRLTDALVHEKIMDGEVGHSGNGKRVWNFVPYYSIDMTHAWLLIEKLESIDPRAIIRVSNGDNDSMDVNILSDGYSSLKHVHVKIEGGSFADAPLAICQACLLAMVGSEE